MKYIFTVLFVMSLSRVCGQSCGAFLQEQLNRKIISKDLHVEGRSEFYPCIGLKVMADRQRPNVLQISGTVFDCSQNTQYPGVENQSMGKVLEVKRSEKQQTLRITQLHFTFEDGEVYRVSNETGRLPDNTVYINSENNPELFKHFKSQLLQRIKIVFSNVNAEYDLRISNADYPTSTQSFFKTLFHCLEW